LGVASGVGAVGVVGARNCVLEPFVSGARRRLAAFRARGELDRL